LGHFIESRVAARAEGSLNALLNLAPEKALRRTIDGSKKEVLVSELNATHEVILKPGDKIPVDGKVVEGMGAVDESMLTGESLPRNKREQDDVYAGTINMDGQLVIQVTATGHSTALARIIEIVQRAQSSRANIQRIGDRVSSVFVPIVIALAILTALWWGLAYDSALKTATTILPFLQPEHFPESPLEAAFVHLAGVLIIACPCAMGLATPAAIMAGVNAAARRGILIRDGEALEKTGTLTTIVFDKTGTLTSGRLDVDADTSLPRENKIATIRLTERSRHPISRALYNHLSSGTQIPGARRQSPDETTRPTDLQNWIELRGRGIEADIGYCRYRLGAIPWLEECGVKIDSTEEIKRLQASGRTVVGLANEDELLQLYALRDKLRRAVPSIVRTLRAQDLQPAMITGDNRVTADAIAHEAGIETAHVHAGVRPEGKAKLIAELQAAGQRLAFVGDGINDAPALEQADLGIAVASASDVARESADIILLKTDIQTIPQAIDLSQATLRTIKQNLFWAFFYNAAAIPIAMLGFVSPIICAAAMGFSDLIVIGNSLRLLRR
ncbi:MAG: heavy metal translocating P-type ATPase, partial [Limisphaerales bacterium]